MSDENDTDNDQIPEDNEIRLRGKLLRGVNRVDERNLTDLDLRSKWWLDDKQDVGMTVLMSERFYNYGLTVAELRSGRPVIGIANSGSDLSPCNYIHTQLAQRVADGVRDAGGLPLVFPVYPIQETSRCPTAAIDRNLAYMALVEVLHGNPIDGVVLTTGCDKTTPFQMMAAATVNIPAICVNSGPMLNSLWRGKRAGSGVAQWWARQEHAKGNLSELEYFDLAISQVPSTGHCNTMGTALTMNCLAEGLGMSLPAQAACPAAYRDRAMFCYLTGKRIVDMVRQDLKPCDIMTRKAFENAIVLNTALGGSTNAQIHINAIAQHAGIEVPMSDWQDMGWDIPLLVNMQPAGKYLGEEFYRAGGVPAVLYELLKNGKLHGDVITANGNTLAQNVYETQDRKVVYSYDKPLMKRAGFAVISGNMFDYAIMKTCVISKDFRKKYLQDGIFEGRAIVFDGAEHYNATIDDPALGIDTDCMLIMRYAGPIGWPGAAEVVNMRPPVYLLEQGIDTLPTMGDGRQSGTSASPSILNAAPEAAQGTGLSIVRNNDPIRLDLNNRTLMLLISDTEYKARMQQWQQKQQTDSHYPASQTPWQEMYRKTVTPLSEGGTMGFATKYQNVGRKKPRHNH